MVLNYFSSASVVSAQGLIAKDKEGRLTHRHENISYVMSQFSHSHSYTVILVLTGRLTAHALGVELKY